MRAAENISRELHIQLGNTTNLYGGDISGSVDIAEKLIPLATQQFAYVYDSMERNKRAADFTHVCFKKFDPCTLRRHSLCPVFRRATR